MEHFATVLLVYFNTFYMRKAFLGLAAAVVLLGAGCATVPAPEGDDMAKETGPIKIGWIGPLTGDAVIYGNPIKDAVELAAKQINEAGGINDRQIEMIYEDGKCNGKDASTAAQKLYNVDGVSYIIGGVCSGEVLAAAPVAEAARKLLISASGSSPDITNAGEFVFRNTPSDDSSGTALAQKMYDDGHRKAVIASEQTDFAEGISLVFSKKFIDLGGEILFTEKFDSAAKDFRSIVTKTKASEADAVFVNPQTTATGEPLIRQMKELDVDLSIYSNTVLTDESFVTDSSEIAEGIILADPPGLSEEREQVVNFKADYVAMFGAEPEFAFYAGSGYDVPFILKQAIEAVGDDADAVRGYLNDMDSYPGIIGDYSFDDNGDLTGIEFILKKIENGTVVEL